MHFFLNVILLFPQIQNDKLSENYKLPGEVLIKSNHCCFYFKILMYFKMKKKAIQSYKFTVGGLIKCNVTNAAFI